MRYQKKNHSDGLVNTILAGGMAGILNWLIAMPADVLKSRLQIGLFLNHLLENIVSLIKPIKTFKQTSKCYFGAINQGGQI